MIFPAEYRGISIRVRGVQIGDAHYLGAEHLLTGANKAALSQITGEINVLAGLDAADTLNPGARVSMRKANSTKLSDVTSLVKASMLVDSFGGRSRPSCGEAR